MKTHTIDTSKFEGFIGGSENIRPAEKPKESRIGYYKDLLESGETINIAFSNQEWKDGLWKVDKDVTIWLENEELSYGNGLYLRDSALTRRFAVKVIRVNEETKTVYTSFREAKKEQQKEVIKEINSALRNKESFIVPARVAWFDTKGKANHCYLDILGVGINGVMFIDQWSYDYDECFADVVRMGDVVNVAITGFAKNSTKEEPRYMCSRKATLEKVKKADKWDSVEDVFKLNSRVVVRCTKKHPGNFEAKVLGYDGWFAYCHYPAGEGFVKVVEGMAYRGFVKDVSSETRKLRVKVIEMVPEAVASDI